MKWKRLEHNGILFPPDFETKKIKIKINGESVDLDIIQEEMIYQWAKKKDTPYAQDKIFQKNFVADFVKTFGSKYKKLELVDIDFRNAFSLVDKEKDAKELLTKEEKKALALKRKELREEMKEKFGKGKMDGKEVEIANYMAEPPGIFIGRGEHPLRGKWKPKVTSKDVTLNLGKEAKVPKGDWGKIVHDKESMWMASWTDYLTQKRKYVWLADTAGIKQDRDKAKYDKAKMLAGEIETVKNKIVKEFNNSQESKNHNLVAHCEERKSDYFPDIVIDAPDGYLITNMGAKFVSLYKSDQERSGLKGMIKGEISCIKSKTPLAVNAFNPWILKSSDDKDLTLIYRHILRTFLGKDSL